MGALKGNSSYLRFMVDGEPPNRFGDLFEQAIEARRFTPLSAESPEDECAGWVPLDAPFDDEIPITRDRFHFGELLVLGYREDKLSIPRSVLRHQIKKKLEALEETGEKLNKQIVKAVELATLAELRQKVLPRPRVLDLVWDYPRHEVRIFGRGPMATERATALFERTFALRLVQASYATRAFALDLSMRARSVLENLGPESLFDDIQPVVEHRLTVDADEE